MPYNLDDVMGGQQAPQQTSAKESNAPKSKYSLDDIMPPDPTLKSRAVGAAKAVGREAVSFGDIALNYVAGFTGTAAMVAGDVAGAVQGKGFQGALQQGNRWATEYNPLSFMDSGASRMVEWAIGEKVDPGITGQIVKAAGEILQNAGVKSEDISAGMIPKELIGQLAQAIGYAVPALGIAKATGVAAKLFRGGKPATSSSKGMFAKTLQETKPTETAPPSPQDNPFIAKPKPHIKLKSSPEQLNPLRDIQKGIREGGEIDPKLLNTIAAIGFGAAAGVELYNENDRWKGALGGALTGAGLLPVLPKSPAAAVNVAKNFVEGSPAASAFTRALTKDATRLAQAFNPDLFGPRAEQAGAVLAKNIVKAAHEELVIGPESEMRQQYWKAKKPDDWKSFAKAIDRGDTKFASPAEQKMADGYKSLLENIYQKDQAKGIKYDPLTSYFPHIFQDAEGAAAFLSTKYGHGWGEPGFAKHRNIDLIAQAEKAGFKLKEVTPEDIVQMRLHASNLAHMKIDTFRELESYGLARSAKGAKPEAGETRWAMPNGESYFVDSRVNAPLHNKFETKSLWSGNDTVSQVYRGAMLAKNKIVPLRLASLFHINHVQMGPSFADFMTTRTKLWAAKEISPLRVGIDAVGKLMFTDIYSSPKMGSELRKAFRGESGPLNSLDQHRVQKMVEGGFNPELSPEFRAKNIRSFKDAIAQHSLTSIYKGVGAAFEALYTKPVFEEWIPNLKAAAYDRATDAALQANPKLAVDTLSRMQAFRKISKMVDDRFGEMNYQTTLMNNIMKDSMTASFLSYGWQLGFVRSGLGAVPELAKGLAGAVKGAKFREQIVKGQYDKSLYVAYYASSTMLYGGLMTFAMTGQAPKGVEDYIMPRSGETMPDGRPARMGTPFYTTTFYKLMKHIEGEGVAKGLYLDVAGKINPVAGIFHDMLTNRDYFNRQIADPKAPLLQEIGQHMEHVITEGRPMWWDAAQRSAGSPGKARALAAGGFAPAPKYATNTPMENKISDAYSQQQGDRVTPFAKGQENQAKQELRSLHQQGRDAEFQSKLQEYSQKYDWSSRKRNTIRKDLDTNPSVKQFRMLSPETKIELYKQMTPMERRIYRDALSEETKRKLDKLNLSDATAVLGVRG